MVLSETLLMSSIRATAGAGKPRPRPPVWPESCSPERNWAGDEPGGAGAGDGVRGLPDDSGGADPGWGDDDGASRAVPEGEDPSGADPREAVGDWYVTAAGHKPEYHLARDCLYASLFRSRLPRWFHNYVKRPPPWVADLTTHLPAPEQDPAV